MPVRMRTNAGTRRCLLDPVHPLQAEHARVALKLKIEASDPLGPKAKYHRARTIIDGRANRTETSPPPERGPASAKTLKSIIIIVCVECKGSTPGGL